MQRIVFPDSLLSLDEDMVRWRILLAQSADMTHRASLVGKPAPITKAIYERMKHPVPGDLVYERSALVSVLAGRDRWLAKHVVGLLDRVVDEPMYTEKEWRADGNTGDIPTEDVWYVRYGPNDEDVVRWRNCTFMAIVLDPDEVERAYHV